MQRTVHRLMLLLCRLLAEMLEFSLMLGQPQDHFLHHFVQRRVHVAQIDDLLRHFIEVYWATFKVAFTDKTPRVPIDAVPTGVLLAERSLHRRCGVLGTFEVAQLVFDELDADENIDDCLLFDHRLSFFIRLLLLQLLHEVHLVL